MSVLSVHDLAKSYRKGFIPRRQLVLESVSFKLSAGSITGFLGANGAGKTTAMKCILGLAYPDRGTVEFFDGKKLSPEVMSRIGFLPERPYFYEYLTGQEFLRFYGQLSGMLSRNDLKDRIAALLKKVDLYEARDRALRTYSKGMLQKIGLAQALIHSPEMVILDEPMSGLDPDGRYYLSELILETARSGAAVFFSSHLLHDTERLCQNIVMLKDGQVIFEGEMSKLLSQMDDKTEILAAQGEQVRTYQEVGQEAVNRRLQELVKSGHQIQEVRPLRRSLEEAFIDLALKVKRK